MSSKNVRRKSRTRDLIVCGLFAALIAILAQISIPMPAGVPLTMQTLGVSLAGIILGGRKGFIATLVYVLMGAVGLPVFAGFTGGLAKVVGATGGFIISFPIMAYIIGVISDKVLIKTNNKGRFNSNIIIFIGMVLGSIVNYAVGVGQFMVVTNSSFIQAVTACVIPFVLTGLLKALLSTGIGLTVRNHSTVREILTYDKA